MRIFFSTIPLFAAASLALGQSVTEVAAGIDADLRASLEELSELRQEIRAERIPIAREISSLESELQELREEAASARRVRENTSFDLRQLEDDVKLRQDEADFVRNLLVDYARTLESRLDPSEKPMYAQTLGAAITSPDNANLTPTQKGEVQFAALTSGIDRALKLLGGQRIEGEAILPDGNVAEGNFLLYGPVTAFAVGETAGIAQIGDSDLPAIRLPSAPTTMAAMAATINAGSGDLPLDPTLGNALALESTQETLMEHISKGGTWIYFILGAALLATAIALFKMIEVFSIAQPSPAGLHRLNIAMMRNDMTRATELAREVPGPTGEMLQEGLRNREEPKELIEEIMYEKILELQPKLERLLQIIAVTAATAPLMGLLGTVTGMINTFKLITIFGTGDARNLSGGISEALITTEFGLIVAIPALIMHAMLSRRVQAILSNMEKTSLAFVNALSRRGHLPETPDESDEAAA